MPTVEELKAARLTALQAGDREAALTLDKAVRRAEDPSWMETLRAFDKGTAPEDFNRELSPAITGAIRGAIDAPMETMQAMGRGAVEGLGGLRDLTAGTLMQAGIPPLSKEDETRKAMAGETWGGLYDFLSDPKAIKRAIRDKPVKTAVTVGSFAIPGAAVAAKVLGAGSKAGAKLGRLADAFDPLKPAATGVQKFREWRATGGAAQELGVEPGTMATLRETFLPGMKEARREADRLGDDASLYDLSTEGRGLAAKVAGHPIADEFRERRQTLMNRAQKQAEEIPQRFERKAVALTGEEPLTNEQAKMDRALARKETDKLYAEAGKEPFDPTPFDNYLTQRAEKFDNDRKYLQSVTRIKGALHRRLTGGPMGGVAQIDNLGRAKTARGIIREEIEALAPRNLAPGQSAFEAGSHTERGQRLLEDYNRLNADMQQNILQTVADIKYRQASEVKEAADMGRKEVIGGKTEPANLLNRVIAWSAGDPRHEEMLDKAARGGLARRYQVSAGTMREGLDRGMAALEDLAGKENLGRQAAIIGQDAAAQMPRIVGQEKTFAKGAKGILDAQEDAALRRGADLGDPEASWMRKLANIPPATIQRITTLSKGDPLSPQNQKKWAEISEILSSHGLEAREVLEVIARIKRGRMPTRGVSSTGTGLMGVLGLTPQEEEKR